MRMARSAWSAGAVVAVLLASAGCSRDQEVLGVLADIDSFTGELVKKVESSADAGAGVDEAQRYLDQRKDEMRGRFKELTSVKGFQISKETTAKVTECATRNVAAVATLQIKHAIRAAQDASFRARLEKLTGDYRALLTP
jgi:hypothetical protein